jgi:hypothetical protein
MLYFQTNKFYLVNLPVPNPGLSTAVYNPYQYPHQITTDGGQPNYAYGFASYTQPIASATSGSEQNSYSHAPYPQVAHTQRSYSNQDLDANTQRLGDTHIGMGYAHPYANTSTR